MGINDADIWMELLLQDHHRIKLCSSEEFPFEAMKAMYPSFASETMVKTLGFMIRAMKNNTTITSQKNCLVIYACPYSILFNVAYPININKPVCFSAILSLYHHPSTGLWIPIDRRRWAAELLSSNRKCSDTILSLVAMGPIMEKRGNQKAWWQPKFFA